MTNCIPAYLYQWKSPPKQGDSPEEFSHEHEPISKGTYPFLDHSWHHIENSDKLSSKQTLDLAQREWLQHFLAKFKPNFVGLKFQYSSWNFCTWLTILLDWSGLPKTCPKWDKKLVMTICRRTSLYTNLEWKSAIWNHWAATTLKIQQINQSWYASRELTVGNILNKSA